VPVPEAVAVGVPVPLTLAVPLELSEVDAVLDAEAPGVSGGVADALVVVLALTVEEGVDGGVLVPVPEVVTVGVPVPLTLAVPLPLSEVDAVLEAEAPSVSDEVGDALVVVLALTVEEGVGGGEPIPLCAGAPVGVPVAVKVPMPLPLNDVEPMFEADAPSVRKAVGVADVAPLAVVVAADDAVAA
jgi:hypothetical protein